MLTEGTMAKRSLLTLLLVFMCTSFSISALAFKRTSVEDTLEDFSFRGLGQQEATFSKSMGARATVLLFWATWSPRSMEALADFQKLYDELGTSGLEVIALNVDKEDLDIEAMRNVEATVSDYGLSYKVAIDEHLTVFYRLGVVAVPSIVLTDSEKTVVGLLDGYSNMTRREFHEQVLEALGVNPPEAEKETARSSAYTPKGKSMRYYQMGELFWRKGLREKAAESFARAVAEDPNYMEACVALTRALEGAGRFKNSEWTDLYVANLPDSCSVEVTNTAGSP